MGCGNSQSHHPALGRTRKGSMTMSLHQETTRTIQSIQRKISVLQEKVSLASRELSVLGRQRTAALQALSALEKEGSV
jgi:hypothetical protein